MKRIFRVLIVIIPVTAFMLFVTGCTSDGFTLGGRYLDSDIHTTIIDTCTIKMTTMTIDSVATSGNGIGLVGHCYDPTYGDVYATTYATYNVPEKRELGDEMIYDSIALMMKLSGTYFGDTTALHTIKVYGLDKTIPEDDSFYSRRDEGEAYYSDNLLASHTFRPHPFTPVNPYSYPYHDNTNYFTIRLRDDFGSDLFNRIAKGDAVLDNGAVFRDYFPGIAVTGEDDNESILGFTLKSDEGKQNYANVDTLFGLRLYYHQSTYKTEKNTINISVDASRNFYGIKYDRQGSLFQDLTDDNEEIPASSTGNMALVQSLTATYVKIEIPYINSLLELGDYGAIVEAYLLLYPVRGSYSDAKPLPQSLVMFTSNEDNVTLNTISNSTGSSAQTGDLVEDKMYNKDTYYSYDVTSFLNSQLGAVGIYKRNLQLICQKDSLSQTFNTVTFGDQKFEKDKTRLIIKYLIYENE